MKTKYIIIIPIIIFIITSIYNENESKNREIEKKIEIENIKNKITIKDPQNEKKIEETIEKIKQIF
jgi:ABC-type enterochelin transport system substrate-binding protein